MVLGKIPLVTFLVVCIMVHAIITRHNKDRKALVASYYFIGIGSFFATLRNLNNIYFFLAKSIAITVDIIAVTSIFIGLILVIYCQLTRKDKQPFGKLPPIK